MSRTPFIFLVSWLCILAGCERESDTRTAVQPEHGAPRPPDPGAQLASIAEYAVWAGGVGLVLAGIIIWFAGFKRGLLWLVISGGLVICGTALAAIAPHIKIISYGVVALFCAVCAYLGWLRREYFEGITHTDLDGDGKIELWDTDKDETEIIEAIT